MNNGYSFSTNCCLYVFECEQLVGGSTYSAESYKEREKEKLRERQREKERYAN